jgi:hypothetical protein
MPRKPAQPNTPAPAPPRNDIVVYESGSDVRLEVRTDGETVWLTQGQICELFGVVKSNVSYHLKNIFGSGELDRSATVQKIRTVQAEGSRQVVRDLEFFNLDVVISLGYRVNSIRATLFRQWATRVLREMLLNKLDEIKRIGALERRMDAAEGDIKQVQAGVNYLVQQLSSPPPDPPRRKIGFAQDRR